MKLFDFSTACASRLNIAYQLRRDTLESEKVLREFIDLETSEEAMYEAANLETEYVEYETLYEDEEEDYDEIEVGKEVEGDEDDANDAVAFLTGILKPKKEIKEEKPKRLTKGVNKQVLTAKPMTPQPRKKTSYNYDPDIEGERRHACNVCSKKFQKRSNLIDHLRLHANVKVYSCEFCERSFVQSGNYKAHLRVHTKEKPYACGDCGKSYSQSSSLKIHQRSHTQEKNYICMTCDKGFTNASDLAKHKLIHDPVKKFRCDECKRGFTQKVHFRKHCEKHHPDLVFEEVENMDETGTTYIIAEEEMAEAE